MATGKEDMTAGSGSQVIAHRSQKERPGSEVRLDRNSQSPKQEHTSSSKDQSPKGSITSLNNTTYR